MFLWLGLIAFQINFVFSSPVRVVELNKGWNLQNAQKSISIKKINIPSGVYSAYAESVGLPLDTILYSKNDILLRWIARDNWTYYLDFDVDNEDIEQTQFINLTFHGIDTISTITLNDETFLTNNMFVRYSYNVKSLLKTKNRLKISLTSPIYAANHLNQKINSFTPPDCPIERYNGECHMNFLRKMQASFGWDWGLAAPSMGIWKSVTLEFHDVAIIRDVDVATSYNKTNEIWELDIRVFIESQITEEYYGNLTFYAVEFFSKPRKLTNKLSITNQVISFKEYINDDKVQRWWPNGFGKQQLYHLHFSLDAWVPQDNIEPDPRKLSFSQKSIRIGFRTIELIENPIDNGNSFYFRVNDKDIFMKGTNYIPSHILPEMGQDQKRIKFLLQSVKNSHMNMIRVWGGGVYESDYFYDMADSLGILIWQDMMFACAMYPVFPEFLESVKIEINQNAKRIAHHASIAIIVTNNENEIALKQNWYGTLPDQKRFKNEYNTLYVENIIKELNIISHKTRINPLVSSPSNGNKIVEEDLIGPGDSHYGDIHFYDYFQDGWDPNIYPNPRFSSEYGFQSLPAKSSWQKILEPFDTIKDLIDHRQHFPMGNVPIINLIKRHLPLPFEDSSDYIDALIYFSQVSQAMATKIETEVYRKNRNTNSNTMGALYWQLNDVWIAPSWSSIDFFGNFKILHHWTKHFMASLTIIAHSQSNGTKIEIFVVSDTVQTESLWLNISYQVYSWRKLFPVLTKIWKTEILPNQATLTNVLNISDVLQQYNANECFIIFSLEGDSNIILSRTFYFPEKIKFAVGMQNPNLIVEVSPAIYKNPISSMSISIMVDFPALFVYIEVHHENVTQYTLSNNGFIQLEPIRIIHLEFKNNSRADITEQNIKVLTVNDFMNKGYENNK